MSKIAKKVLLLGILTGTMLVSFADRGIGKKSKKVILNVNTNNCFKNSISFNLKAGLKYKGSLLSNVQQQANNSLLSTELVTYQKGNNIFIVPYKQKIVVPEIRQGYTGLKLIIKTY
jgi:hypothetical protein